MFDLRVQVRLQQARNALRGGRLDEAFAIAMGEGLRDYRGGQVLLERLVDPLLDRAANHLAEGRPREALEDVDRAIAAGGNRPRAARLRQDVANALVARERSQRNAREMAVSVNRHLQKGSVRTAMEILEEAQAREGDPGVVRLWRRARRQERKGAEAAALAERHFKRGELVEALTAAWDGMCIRGRKEPDLSDLLHRLKNTVFSEIEQALRKGDLKSATRLLHPAQRLFAESLEVERFEEALALSRKAGEAIQAAAWEDSRTALERFQKLVPKTPWVEEALLSIETITGRLRSLKTGPLGDTLSPPVAAVSPGGPGGGFMSKMETFFMQPSPDTSPKGNAAKPPLFLQPERFHLWIDGVGTYLILTSDRVAIGRLGSSTRPDIPLQADLAGHHAEIQRAEDDYFVVSKEGNVEVGGRAVTRKLLEDGDRIRLAARCSFNFLIPTSLSTTAVLNLRGSLRVQGDVRQILLLGNHILLGPQENCHIRVRGTAQPVILLLKSGRLFCRARDEILVGERPVGQEIPAPFGDRVQVGELTFTVTPANRKEA